MTEALAMPLLIPTEFVPLVRDPSGVLQVGDSRVTLDLVVTAFHQGASAEEIVQQYPSLDLADVYLVLGFYLGHRAEIEAYLQEREQQADDLRKQIEARWPP